VNVKELVTRKNNVEAQCFVTNQGFDLNHDLKWIVLPRRIQGQSTKRVETKTKQLTQKLPKLS
jgi:hypothetical protein